MYKIITISTENGTYKMSALLNDKGYCDPSLDIYDDGECIETWDNDKFLILELYPYLKGECENIIFDEWFLNVKKEVLEIFEEAIKIGFFN